MIPREPLRNALARERVAEATLNALEHDWKAINALLVDLSDQFPEFHAAYLKWQEAARVELSAIEAVWREREALLKSAPSYTDPYPDHRWS